MPRLAAALLFAALAPLPAPVHTAAEQAEKAILQASNSTGRSTRRGSCASTRR